MKYIIFLTTMSVLFITCIKEECKINGGRYEFEIPATLSPPKDTFNIGDTITIMSTFPDKVYERKTDKWYILENFRFYPGTLVSKIDTSEAISEVQSYFDFIIHNSFEYGIQVFSGGSEMIVGQYTYSNNAYSLEFKLVAKKSGLYYIEQSVAPDIARHQDFDGKCSNLEVGGAVFMNNGDDNNIHMLSDSPDPHYNDWILQKPEQRFHKFGGYCFYVNE